METTRTISIMDIAEIVANYFDLTITELCSRTRKREIVQARQFAYALCIEKTKYTLEKIGEKIGNKDHATVLYAKRVISNLCDTEKAIRYDYNFLINKIDATIVSINYISNSANFRKAKTLKSARVAAKRNRMSYNISYSL